MCNLCTRQKHVNKSNLRNPSRDVLFTETECQRDSEFQIVHKRAEANLMWYGGRQRCFQRCKFVKMLMRTMYYIHTEGMGRYVIIILEWMKCMKKVHCSLVIKSYKRLLLYS